MGLVDGLSRDVHQWLNPYSEAKRRRLLTTDGEAWLRANEYQYTQEDCFLIGYAAMGWDMSNAPPETRHRLQDGGTIRPREHSQVLVANHQRKRNEYLTTVAQENGLVRRVDPVVDVPQESGYIEGVMEGAKAERVPPRRGRGLGKRFSSGYQPRWRP